MISAQARPTNHISHSMKAKEAKKPRAREKVNEGRTSVLIEDRVQGVKIPPSIGAAGRAAGTLAAAALIVTVFEWR